jgi:hypothetical protein
VQIDIPSLTSQVAGEISRPFRRMGGVRPIRRKSKPDTMQTSTSELSNAMDGNTSTTLEATSALHLQNSTSLKRAREESPALTQQAAATIAPVPAREESPASTQQVAATSAPVPARDESPALTQQAVATSAPVPTPPASAIEGSTSSLESKPYQPSTDEHSVGGDTRAMGNEREQQQQQHQGKKKKKQGPCKVWETVISAVKKKDSAAAWELYQHHHAEHSFSVPLLQALTTLFLGTNTCSCALLGTVFCCKKSPEHPSC